MFRKWTDAQEMGSLLSHFSCRGCEAGNPRTEGASIATIVLDTDWRERRAMVNGNLHLNWLSLSNDQRKRFMDFDKLLVCRVDEWQLLDFLLCFKNDSMRVRDKSYGVAISPWGGA